jgi:hypothetical protein
LGTVMPGYRMAQSWLWNVREHGYCSPIGAAFLILTM